MEDEDKARKCSKRPFMTKTYNCTRVGARDQVKDELKKMGMSREHLYPKQIPGVILDHIRPAWPCE